MYIELLRNAVANDLNKIDIKKVEASLTSADKKSIDYQWLKTYGNVCSYCDNLYDVLDKAENLPVVPQQYHGDVKTSLDTKLKLKSYEVYYNKVKLIAEGEENTKSTVKPSESVIAIHEKLLTAYYLTQQYKKLDMDSVILSMTTKSEKSSIFFVWYDCCGRIKDKHNTPYLKGLLVSILKEHGGDTDEEKLLSKYESSYSKLLSSKIERGLKK